MKNAPLAGIISLLALVVLVWLGFSIFAVVGQANLNTQTNQTSPGYVIAERQLNASVSASTLATPTGIVVGALILLAVVILGIVFIVNMIKPMVGGGGSGRGGGRFGG